MNSNRLFTVAGGVALLAALLVGSTVLLLGSRSPWAAAVISAILVVLTVIGVSIAISRRLQAASKRVAELEEASARAQSALQARTKFVAGLSDQIKAPLLRILKLTESTMDLELNSQQRDKLSSLRMSAEKVTELLNDLLDLSRVRVGQLELNHEPFELREGIDEAISPLKFKAKWKNLKLTTHVQPRIPNQLGGDAKRLEQILQNLISNAIQYTSEGSVVLRVSTARRDEDQIELLFAVDDTGPGVAPEIEPYLFALPEQRPTDKTAPQGLGLAVANELAQLLGSGISYSKTPKGSRFEFSARFRVLAETSQPTQRTQLGLIPDLPVLILSDDQETADGLESQLIRWQTRPSTLRSEEDLLDALEQSRKSQYPIGLIIVDQEFRGRQGVDVASELKKHQLHAAIPIILLMDVEKPVPRVKTEKAGVSTTMHKPIRSSQLAKSIVTAVLGQGRYQQMRRDLSAAEMYVRSLMPPPVDEPLPIDWRYVPAADLAGDALGFHWIDEDHCSFYVLDVTGHGLDAALLSVTILNSIKAMTLPDTDFRRPEQVLAQLNQRFPMESHGDRCFTLWYGVYNRQERELTWSAGSHPAALMKSREGDKFIELGATGPLLGMLPDSEFPSQTMKLEFPSRLYVYSDGVYEIETPQGEFWSEDQFRQFLFDSEKTHLSPLDALWEEVRRLHGSATLEDDFTVLEVKFLEPPTA